MRGPKRFGVLVLAGAAVAAGAFVSTGSSVVGAAGATGSGRNWQKAIAAVPLPRKGCFSATYPALTWRSTPCKTAPNVPMEPAVGNTSSATPFAPRVGNGNDYSAVVSAPITEATGSFADVSPGITETGRFNGRGPRLVNAFTLQLNTQYISGSPACSGSADPSNCLAWQQFVYDTYSNSVFIQYWLIDYAATCPTSWYTYGNSCFTNSPASTFPGGALTASELASVQLSGVVQNGGNDSVELSNGTQVTSVDNPDSVIDLAPNWTTTEFGVYGDGGGSEAKFSAKSTIEAVTTLTSSSLAAPHCVNEGFTGETNNLKLTATPAIGTATAPTIASEQTNGKLTSASCASAPG
jgi:hypothetical protein